MLVYKYLAPERVHALRDATLRATQANALNDPFELKPFFATILEKADLEQKIRERSFEAQLRDAYMKQPAELRAKMSWSKIRALSRQQPFKQQLHAFLGLEIDNVVDNVLPDVTKKLRGLLYEQLGNNVGIVSFSEAPDDGLMWAHYANDYKGFVVEFDGADAFFDRRRSEKDEFFHLRPVEYQERAVCKFSDLDGAKLLCAKQTRWSYEREQRMLIPVDPSSYPGEGEPVHLINFPRNVVRSVILGYRASDSLVVLIKDIIAATPGYEHVRLLRASPDLSKGIIAIGDPENGVRVE